MNDYPGVSYEHERDVLAERGTEPPKVTVPDESDKVRVRTFAANLAAEALALNNEGPVGVSDIIKGAAELEAYILGEK